MYTMLFAHRSFCLGPCLQEAFFLLPEVHTLGIPLVGYMGIYSLSFFV